MRGDVWSTILLLTIPAAAVAVFAGAGGSDQLAQTFSGSFTALAIVLAASSAIVAVAAVTHVINGGGW